MVDGGSGRYVLDENTALLHVVDLFLGKILLQKG